MIPGPMVEATNFPGQKAWVGGMSRVGSLEIFSNHTEIVDWFKSATWFGLGGLSAVL